MNAIEALRQLAAEQIQAAINLRGAGYTVAAEEHRQEAKRIATLIAELGKKEQP